ncbi:hypothetical protein K505DRAFT_369099 [Melanomma pulvis-pyrius CBS 109.77]|uniref:Uncharacterized protein n=1 Tax=Melanomma pulvis-pyrius CBS 109.77 TaxID=1314802 RepID=A0A6A6WN83_9PLEO|nr:hypothetical protein K505DRAFT_369099 [Melanomma pulvis-pyrius CBS 109.77]
MLLTDFLCKHYSARSFTGKPSTNVVAAYFYYVSTSTTISKYSLVFVAYSLLATICLTQAAAALANTGYNTDKKGNYTPKQLGKQKRLLVEEDEDYSKEEEQGKGKGQGKGKEQGKGKGQGLEEGKGKGQGLEEGKGKGQELEHSKEQEQGLEHSKGKEEAKTAKSAYAIRNRSASITTVTNCNQRAI